MNIVAFGAHPDDLDAFVGGTLALYGQQGHKVFMAIVTDGRGRPKGDPESVTKIRRAEAQASADLIGAELVWMGIPDGELMHDEPSRHKFIEVIREANADVILTHPAADYHPDHTATSSLTLDAAQVARTANYRSKFAPVRKPVPVGFYDSEFGLEFVPEDYVDITSVYHLKEQMLFCHRSQHMPSGAYDPDFVLPESEKVAIVRAARVMSEFRGLGCGVQYAEGFRWWRAANRVVPRRVLP
jgi:LmbE family N-acetylglucosaminyl deacetylase